MNTGKQQGRTIGVLVRKFPNIVQTYVLNHILSIQDAGDRPLIIAEVDPRLDVVHPDIDRRGLRDIAMYVKPDRAHLPSELGRTPWFDPRYLRLAFRCLLSPALAGFGIGYRLKSMLSCRVLSRGEIDIVHSHSMFTSHAYLFLKRCFGVPVVTTFHGLVPNNVKMLPQSQVEQVIDGCDAFFCNTRFAEHQLLDMGCPQHKIRIIPQGTNTTDFPFVDREAPQDGDVIVLSVGRLSVEKGFHIAIEAIAKLRRKIPRIRYRIIGRGLEHEALQQKIDELGLAGHVTLLGGVSTEELVRNYAEAHMFVLPSIDLHDGSHTETQGVVLQEAQSSGLPVIASRTGGIPEVIHHGETGLLFDEADSDQLADNIDTLVNDAEFYRRLCLQARREVDDHYSISAIYQQLDAVYRDVIGEDGN